MKTFRFDPHGKIQEYVAIELGIFADEKLLCEAGGERRSKSKGTESAPSAYADYVESAKELDVSSTSMWSVGRAETLGVGRIYRNCYSVMPSGVYAGPDMAGTSVHDLLKTQIIVGRHSGSHFSLLSTLDALGRGDALPLEFVAGRKARLKTFLDRRASAGSFYGAEAYLLEQLGYRKIIDTSFLVFFLVRDHVCSGDVAKYFRSLQRAQLAIDAQPSRFSHYLHHALAAEHEKLYDPLRSGIGERIVAAEISEDLINSANNWAMHRRIFE